MGAGHLLQNILFHDDVKEQRKLGSQKQKSTEMLCLKYIDLCQEILLKLIQALSHFTVGRPCNS